MENRIDDLGIGNLKIIQNKKYFCFGVDAVLLSHFSKTMRENGIVLDIGTGNGILPLLLSHKTNQKKIYGIEIQKELFGLANENVKLNNLSELIELINDNICNIEKHFKSSTFDTIVCNPPYKKKGSGLTNENEYIQIAKHEIHCSLEDIISKSSYLLNNSGKLFMVHRPDRLVDILYFFRKYNIEPKTMQFVHSRLNEPPVLVLIEGIKTARPFLKIQKPLYIYDNENNYTEEINKIYGKD